MTSIWHGLMVLAMQLGAVSPNNPATGKPWDSHLIPSCDDLIPKGLREQWGLKVATAARDPDVYFGPSCVCERGQQKVPISTIVAGPKSRRQPLATAGSGGSRSAGWDETLRHSSNHRRTRSASLLTMRILRARSQCTGLIVTGSTLPSAS
jgi:hypothetical protein